MKISPFVLLLGWLLCTTPLAAQSWRTEPLSAMDRQYMAGQVDSINQLARSKLGLSLSGKIERDIPLLQQLLDRKIVGSDDVQHLQAMGIVLGELLKSKQGLLWIIYIDKLGRSRALQVPGVDDEFIFPATQISRRREVGIDVQVTAVYSELEAAVTAIREKPEL